MSLTVSKEFHEENSGLKYLKMHFKHTSRLAYISVFSKMNEFLIQFEGSGSTDGKYGSDDRAYPGEIVYMVLQIG